MDCDSCGRYRPSGEVAPLRDPVGRLVMACSRCRRPAHARGDLGRASQAPGPRPTPIPVLTIPR
jgi:hypothetical protein